MKVQKVDLNEKACRQKRNRWYDSYHSCINSSRCNKIFGLIFVMSIGGIFIASIILACVRADMIHIDFGTRLMNSTDDSPIAVDKGEAVADSLRVEGFLEAIGDAFSSVEDFPSGDDSTTEPGRVTSKEATDESPPPNLPQTDDTVPPEVTTTTIITTTTQKPNSCKISLPVPLNADEPCLITCADVSSLRLSDEIKAALQSELSKFGECPSDEFDVTLTRITFNEGAIEEFFLADLPASIRKLTITASTVTQIFKNAFNSTVFAETITLVIESTQSALYLLNSDHFRGLPKLETLQLSNLSRLEIGTPLVLSPLAGSLITLIVYQVSSLWSVESLLANASLSRVKTITLQYNNFEDLPFDAGTFRNVCGSIETLRLTNSRVKMLSADTFSQCPYLSLLDLRSNNIETLPVGVFDNLPALKNLYLQNNKFTTLPHGLLTTVLAQPSLRNVNLDNNSWHCDFDIAYVKQVLTTHAHLITINSCVSPEERRGVDIRDLWCSFDSCAIYCDGVFGGDLASALSVYNEVDCERVHLMLANQEFAGGFIEDFWLADLRFPIDSLAISFTCVESIKNNTFNSEFFGNLRELSIDNNAAGTFIINGLGGLRALEVLSITQSAVLSVTQETELFLSAVRSNLRELHISVNNDFKVADLFKSVTMENLQVLRLDGNKFASVNITRSTFRGVHSCLEEIYLNNSQISRIPTSAFADFQKLKRIHLEDNRLTTLSANMFCDLIDDPDLVIFLSGNLWHCDCDLENLVSVLNVGDSVVCASPEDYSGSEIAELEEKCKSTTYSQELSPSKTDTSEPVTTSTTTTEKSPTTTNTTTSLSTTISTTTPTTTTTTELSSTTPLVCVCPISTTLPEDTTSTTMTTTSEPDEEEEPPITTPLDEARTSHMPCTVPTFTTPEGKTTTPRSSGELIVECFDIENSSPSNVGLLLAGLNLMRALNSRDAITLLRPIITFQLRDSDNQDEVIVEFNETYDDSMVLVYYPAMEDPFEGDNASSSVRCISITAPVIVVVNLAPDTVYTFCALYRLPQRMMITPFQCKSHSISQSHPWLYEEQKAIIITSLTLLLLLALVIGIVMTYFLIRRIPTLIRGSKRVVLVNNRAKEVMILPRSNSDSHSNNSCRKESITPVTAEPPTYLTPLPRQSIDHRPPFVRSNSDTSLKSYVSVSRLPPRFSQVFQRSDFDCDSPRRCGSYSHCHPSAPCQHQSPELPPPLPRRSVVSTSSTHNSSASTAEIGKPPLSRASAHNSTYRRQSRPIEIEQENHYNFII